MTPKLHVIERFLRNKHEKLAKLGYKIKYFNHITLVLAFPRDKGLPVAIWPLVHPNTEGAILLRDISPDSSSMDPLPQIRPITGSLALQIQEIGYGFTSSRKACRQYLEALKVAQFTPNSVAHILAMMIRTHTGLTAENYPMATVKKRKAFWLNRSNAERQATPRFIRFFFPILKQL